MGIIDAVFWERWSWENRHLSTENIHCKSLHVSVLERDLGLLLRGVGMESSHSSVVLGLASKWSHLLGFESVHLYLAEQEGERRVLLLLVDVGCH